MVYQTNPAGGKHNVRGQCSMPFRPTIAKIGTQQPWQNAMQRTRLFPQVMLSASTHKSSRFCSHCLLQQTAALIGQFYPCAAVQQLIVVTVSPLPNSAPRDPSKQRSTPRQDVKLSRSERYQEHISQRNPTHAAYLDVNFIDQ